MIQKLSEDTAGGGAQRGLVTPPPALHAQLRNPLGTAAHSYRKTYFGYSDVTSWHSEAVGMEKLTGRLGQRGAGNTNNQEKMSSEQAGGLSEGSRTKEGVRGFVRSPALQQVQAGTKPTAWQRSLSPHRHHHFPFRQWTDRGELTCPG